MKTVKLINNHPLMQQAPSLAAGSTCFQEKRRRESFQSTLLTAVIDRLNLNRPKFSVLDLGAALASNISFFSEFHCSLRIEDIFSFYERPAQVSESGAEVSAAFAELLAYPAEMNFDLILVWDLINYLRKDELGALVEQIECAAAPGGSVHLFNSNNPFVPDKPGLFRLNALEGLSYDACEARTHVPLRLSSGELERYFGRFRVERSLLHRNGFQEVVLALK